VAVAGLHVGEPVVFFRERPEGLGENGETADRQGQFPGFGAKQGPFEPHEVPDVQLFESGKILVPDLLALHIGLEPPAAVLEVAKDGLAELADQHEPAGQPKGPVQALQFLAAQGPELFDYLGHGVAGLETVVKGVDPLSPQFSQLLSSLGDDAVGLGHGGRRTDSCWLFKISLKL